MAKTSCVPPSTLRFGSLPGLLDKLPLGRWGGSHFDINLKRLRWIEALPLAVIAAYMNDRRRHPGGMIYVPSQYAFLQRMDFFRAVGAKGPPERFKRHNASGRFIPVRTVTEKDRVDKVATEIVQTLRVDDEGAADVLRYCVGEIIDNVFVHADSPTRATVCAQHFPNAKRTQVAIVDTGLGFKAPFEHLRPGLSDRDAITLGLEPYITSKPYENFGSYASGYGRLGLGLFIATEILTVVGGQILVASGDTLLRRTPNGHRWQEIAAWQGAIVAFEVPDSTAIPYASAIQQARELADQLAAQRRTR